MKKLVELLEQTDKLEIGDKVVLKATKNKNNTLKFNKVGTIGYISSNKKNVSVIYHNPDMTIIFDTKYDRLEKV